MTNYGDDAITVARHIHGCQGVGGHEPSPGDFDSGTAYCYLYGEGIEITTWPSKASDDRGLAAIKGVPFVYAAGRGWSELYAGDDISLTQERRVARRVVESLGGKIIDRFAH